MTATQPETRAESTERKLTPGLTDASQSPYPFEEIARCGCCHSARWRAVGRAQGLELRKCRDCGTVRFASVVSMDHLYDDGYHDGTSEFGWDFESERPYQLALSNETLGWLETFVRQGRLIDIGGGMGYFAAIAKDRGWDATLLEPVAHACEFARENFGINAIAAGADALAALGNEYEAVTLCHALEHFDDPLTILEQVKVAIAPEGVLFVEVPNFASGAHRFQGDAWYGLQVGQHIHHFTPATLRAVVARAGYEVIRIETKVPTWDGLIPSAYAHFIGLETILHGAVGLKRRFARNAEESAEGPGAGTETRWRPPVPINETSGLQRAVFGRGFAMIARLEETIGLGTNLRLVARPRK